MKQTQEMIKAKAEEIASEQWTDSAGNKRNWLDTDKYDAAMKMAEFLQSQQEESEAGKMLNELSNIHFICNHEWIAVFPSDYKKLDCPHCKNICGFEIILDIIKQHNNNQK